MTTAWATREKAVSEDAHVSSVHSEQIAPPRCMHTSSSLGLTHSLWGEAAWVHSPPRATIREKPGHPWDRNPVTTARLLLGKKWGARHPHHLLVSPPCAPSDGTDQEAAGARWGQAGLGSSVSSALQGLWEEPQLWVE